MTNDKDPKPAPKSKWEKPEIVDLDLAMDDVQNGLGAGTDGAGGFSTSAS